MTPEDKLLFACIRQDFSDARESSEAQREALRVLCDRYTIRWEVVYATAVLHDVAPLVYANLSQCLGHGFEIPPPFLEQFERAYYHNLIAQAKIAERIGQVLAHLNQAGVDVMLVKGGALALFVYAHPWYTTMNDVDLLFRQNQAHIAPAVPRFLDAFQDIHFEYDYVQHHDVTMNGMLPVDFERIWNDAVERDVQGQKVWVMSPEDLVIATCINSCRKRFFRLKALRDLAEILNRYDKLRWDELVRKARADQCNHIVYAALVVTVQWMGVDIPDWVLDGLAVPPLRAALIRYLSRNLSFTSLTHLYSGNRLFGREVGRGLLLPYATYRWDQIWKRIRFVSDARFRRQRKR